MAVDSGTPLDSSTSQVIAAQVQTPLKSEPSDPKAASPRRQLPVAQGSLVSATAKRAPPQIPHKATPPGMTGPPAAPQTETAGRASVPQVKTQAATPPKQPWSQTLTDSRAFNADLKGGSQPPARQVIMAQSGPRTVILNKDEDSQHDNTPAIVREFWQTIKTQEQCDTIMKQENPLDRKFSQRWSVIEDKNRARYGREWPDVLNPPHPVYIALKKGGTPTMNALMFDDTWSGDKLFRAIGAFDPCMVTQCPMRAGTWECNDEGRANRHFMLKETPGPFIVSQAPLTNGFLNTTQRHRPCLMVEDNHGNRFPHCLWTLQHDPISTGREGVDRLELADLKLTVKPQEELTVAPPITLKTRADAVELKPRKNSDSSQQVQAGGSETAPGDSRKRTLAPPPPDEQDDGEMEDYAHGVSIVRGQKVPKLAYARSE